MSEYNTPESRQARRQLAFSSPPTSEEESSLIGNMLFAEGHYPAGTSDCFNVGIMGGCGFDCFVLQEGRCDCFLDANWSEEELSQLYEDGLYEKEIEWLRSVSDCLSVCKEDYGVTCTKDECLEKGKN
jgi:hypothetical protein